MKGCVTLHCLLSYIRASIDNTLLGSTDSKIVSRTVSKMISKMISKMMLFRTEFDRLHDGDDHPDVGCPSVSTCR